MITAAGDAVRAHAQALREHLAAGDFAGAEQRCARILELDPAHVEALNVAALAALSRDRHDAAIDLLERALAVAAGDAATLRNLGIALRRAGRIGAARDMLRRAVDADPQSFVARLDLGEACEALADGDAALAAYFGAIRQAQAAGRWRNDATTAPALRARVRHAMQVVDRGRAAWFERVVAPLRERFGRDELVRVEHGLAIHLGERPAVIADPRQQPTLFHLPGLPATPWFERALFPWHAELEDAFAGIRAELEALLADASGFEPFLDIPPSVDAGAYLQGREVAPQWNAYFFHRHGERFEANCARCPRTAAALDGLPLVRIRAHAPECLFSLLTPGSHIMPHYGVTNTRIVTHLPLIVPEDCVLRVGGEDHVWQEGRCVSFDDTFLHEAWNRSTRTRVVMLMDTWNPHMSEAEKIATGELVAAIGDFNRAAMA